MSRRAWTQLLNERSSCPPRRRDTRSRARTSPVVMPIGVTPSIQVLPVTPVPKPRQTRRDRWAKRACVLRYRAFCDELRLRNAQLPDRYALIFVMPMPRSWSATKCAQMEGRPHQQKPDLSNLEKSVEDALVPNDERLFSNRGVKVWGRTGKVVILSRRDEGAEDSDATLLALALAETGVKSTGAST